MFKVFLSYIYKSANLKYIHQKPTFQQMKQREFGVRMKRKEGRSQYLRKVVQKIGDEESKQWWSGGIRSFYIVFNFVIMCYSATELRGLTEVLHHMPERERERESIADGRGGHARTGVN